MICSPIRFLWIIGLYFFICFSALSSQEKKEKDKVKSEEGELIINSGVGPYDFKNPQNNKHYKNIQTNRKQAGGKSSFAKECPGCKNKIPVVVVESPNDSIDTDLCEHFLGSSEYEFEIWACSLCGLSLHKSLFQSPIVDEEKEFIKKYLKPNMENAIKQAYNNLFKDLDKVPLKQEIIPLEVKVINFSQFVDHHNFMSAKWKAFYTIRSLYAIRNKLLKSPAVTSLSKAFISISKKMEVELNVEDEEKKKPFISKMYERYYQILLDSEKDLSTRIALKLLKSQMLVRLGFHDQAIADLNSAQSDLQKKEELKDAEGFITESIRLINLEKKLMKKAISYMTDAIEAKQYETQMAGIIIYLVGELYRRTNEAKNAYLWLNAAKQFFPEASPIQNWIAEFNKQPSLTNQTFKDAPNPALLDEFIKNNK